MNRLSHLLSKALVLPAALACLCPLIEAKNVTIDKKYMNVPLLRTNDRSKFREFKLLADGQVVGLFNLPYAADKADYYSGTDMSHWKGKLLELQINGEQKDLDAIVFSDSIVEDVPSYSEKDRPQYHFSARRGWINDPNGLVYYKGVYHMYYQHNPFNIFWENMSWGHATSKDLVHWEEQANVLWPIEYHRGGLCFSGAAIIDEKNLLGKKTGEEDPILAFYLRTGIGLSLAYSNDAGQSFTDFEGNPVIKNSGVRIDTPRPVWFEGTKKWVAPTYDSYKTESGEMKRCVGFYSSDDLVHWSLESRLIQSEAHDVNGDELCGCVDFFQMSPEGKPEEKKWVLIFIDGSYLVGDFDGKTFYNLEGKPAVTGDRKQDLVIDNFFYATMTWYNAPNNRRIQTAWFTRGHSDAEISVFAERFTLPSELSLHEEQGQYTLKMNPIAELKKLRAKSMVKKNMSVDAIDKLLAKLDGDLYEFTIKLSPKAGEILDFTINGQHIIYNGNDQVVSLNGVASPLAAIEGEVSMQIFVDRNTIELYGNGGRVYIPVVCSDMHKQELKYGMQSADGAKLNHFEVHQLKSVWEKKK